MLSFEASYLTATSVTRNLANASKILNFWDWLTFLNITQNKNALENDFTTYKHPE